MGFLNFILHLDTNLSGWAAQYGALTYALLFGIIFLETGVVIFPFLPGDSLLFTAGALAAKVNGPFNPWLLFVVFVAAAVAGDSVNFEIGKRFGTKLFAGKHHVPFFKPENLDKTKAFFAKHGKKAIILARFVPIIRTFAPFVAGTGEMHYGTFLTYNVIGAIAWVTLLLGSGYLFGNLRFIQTHFYLVVIVIVALSLVPVVWEWVGAKKEKADKAAPAN